MRTFRSLAVSLAMAATAVLGVVHSANATPYSETYNQAVGPGDTSPSCCYWVPSNIGWYWTPGESFSLATIGTTLFGAATNINNNFNLTVTLYSERPVSGGSTLASATFNPSTSSGASFASAFDVSAGTEYFVGFSGWDGPLTSTGGGGINWVIQDNVTAGLPGVEYLGDAYFADGYGTSAGMLAPVISFAGVTADPPIDPTNVPEPSSIALVSLGLAGASVLRRRRQQQIGTDNSDDRR